MEVKCIITFIWAEETQSIHIKFPKVMVTESPIFLEMSYSLCTTMHNYFKIGRTIYNH